MVSNTLWSPRVPAPDQILHRETRTTLSRAWTVRGYSVMGIYRADQRGNSMRIEQIEVKGGDKDDPQAIPTLAIADDVFAIHPTNYGAIQFDAWEGSPNIAFTLTHRPTGYAIVDGRSWVEVLGFWNEIHARKTDWNISDPARVAKELGPEVRSIRKAVEARVLAASESAQPVGAVDPVGE